MFHKNIIKNTLRLQNRAKKWVDYATFEILEISSNFHRDYFATRKKLKNNHGKGLVKLFGL